MTPHLEPIEVPERDGYLLIPSGMTPRYAHRHPNTPSGRWLVHVEGYTPEQEFNNDFVDWYRIADLPNPATITVGDDLGKDEEEWYRLDQTGPAYTKMKREATTPQAV